MTGEPQYLPGCTGKQVWTHGYAARAEARKIRRHVGGRKQHAFAYECPFCGLWHLSSSAMPRQDGRDRAGRIMGTGA